MLLVATTAMAVLLGGPAAPPPYPGGNWTAHRLFGAAKLPPVGTNARCLDGSPPLYYYSAGYGSGVDKWEIHMEGGAWCKSGDDCATWWGYRSTLVDPDTMASGAPNTPNSMGYFNRTDPDNAMANWNYVMIRYCDGYSFASNAEAGAPGVLPARKAEPPSPSHPTGVPAQPAKNVTLWRRGKAILDAVIADLLAAKSEATPPLPTSMATAAQVTVGGCSAGGMAVFLHCDTWAARIKAANPKVATKCLADAGWFQFIPANFTPAVGGPTVAFPSGWFNGVWKSGFAWHNASGGCPSSCIKAHTNSSGQLDSTAFQCSMAQTASLYVKTPLFALQSQFDSFQVPNMMRCPFPPHHPTDAPCSQASVDAYGAMLSENVEKWLTSPLAQAAGSAAFVDSCYHHCPSLQYSTIQATSPSAAKGLTGGQLFGRWLQNPKALAGLATQPVAHFGTAKWPCTGMNCCPAAG